MLLALFGFGMVTLGGIMLFNPVGFANGIARFSSKSGFHCFEIASRLSVGLLFIWQSRYSSYPLLLLVLGGMLCFASIFLIVVGSRRHQRFALATANIGVWFRPLGIIALAAGGAFMYLGVVK